MGSIVKFLLQAPSLELYEADILAELPAMKGWAIAPETPLAREVLSDLPALAGLQEPRP